MLNVFFNVMGIMYNVRLILVNDNRNVLFFNLKNIFTCIDVVGW